MGAPAPEYAPIVELDALDRADFDTLVASSAALGELSRRGRLLLPDFHALLRDLYALHAKAVVRLTSEEGRPATEAVRRRLVGELLADERYRQMHRVTQLRPAVAGLATLRTGQAVLKELKAGRLMLERELRAQMVADAAQRESETLQAEIDAAKSLAERTQRPVVRAALDAEARNLEEAQRQAQEAVKRQTKELQRAAADVPTESLDTIGGQLTALAERMDAEAPEQLSPLPLPMEAATAGDGGADPVAALDLSERLASNRLLLALSRLLGAFRAEARAARRDRTPRARSEIYGLTRGDTIGRLLPHELSAMRHPVWRRDFRRRLFERQLMCYRTRGEERQGRGPVVICLDVSGSMVGAKALWAKAVALTIADRARCQRRAVSVLTFSSGQRGLRHHQLVDSASPRAGRKLFGREALLSFAEQQVGGGTDFQPPLDRARQIIEEERRFERGDIVVITDGQASLPAPWVEDFAEFRRRRQCHCLAVVIDVGSHELPVVEGFCDGVVRVSELTSGNARAVFAAFDR